jgi:hypothetical protein
VLWHVKTFDNVSFAHDEVKAATCYSRMRGKSPRYGADCAGHSIAAYHYFFQSVWMQQGTDLFTPKGLKLSKADKLHCHHAYNMGVHSCVVTSVWLYDGPHSGCAFVLKYYHLQRVRGDV